MMNAVGNENFAAAALAENWTANGRKMTVAGDGSISAAQVAPSGKDHIINIDCTLRTPADISAHAFLLARLKLKTDSPNAVRLKMNLYSAGKEKGNGYLYGRTVQAAANGEWNDYELDMNGKRIVQKNFDNSSVRRFRIVLICANAEERIDVNIGHFAFGESVQAAEEAVLLQLSALGEQAAAFAAFTAKPPVLDGNLDDECWQNTVKLTDFHANKGGLATEQTEAFLCHDRKNLYIGVKAYTATLDPVSNLASEFKDAVTEHDGGTYNDDCIEIFFTGKPDFRGQIVANLHTTFERTVSAQGSDTSWNPPLQLKGKKHIGSARTGAGGFYVIELAVPLAELQRFTGSDGELTFNIGRQNRYLKELSNWARASSFHTASRYAKLVFGETAIGAAISGLTVQDGRPGVTWRLHEEPQGARPSVGIELIYSPSKSELKSVGMMMGEHRFSLTDTAANFVYSTLIHDRGKILYRSPLGHFGAGLAVASGSVSGEIPAGTKIFVNGVQLGDSRKFDLVKGKNMIAVETAQIPQWKIGAGDLNEFSIDGTWKFSRQAEENWNQFSFNDRDWAAFSGESAAAGRMFLRKTILVGESRFYPLINETEALRASAGAVQPFSVVVSGLKGEEIEDYRFYVELPDDVEFAGASGQSGRHFGRERCSWEKTGAVKRDGENYSCYEIKFTGNVRKTPGIVRYVAPEKLQVQDLVVLAIRPPQNRRGKTFTGYYSMTANNGSYTELKRPLKVRVLPELSGKTPKRMLMLTWFSFRDLDDKTLQRRIYQEHANAGFNIANTNSWQADVIKPTGMKYCSRFNFEANGFNPAAVLKKYPDAGFIDHTGKTAPCKVPFYHIVHNAPLRKDLRAAFDDYLRACKPDILDWDFEFDVFRGFYSSYDPGTLEFFKKKYQISEPLNPTVIKEKYEPQWTVFMNELTAEVFRFLREATAAQGIQLDVYSGYPSEYTRSHYGIDYELILPNVDFAMMGYGRPREQIKEILRLSKKFNKPVLFGVCARPYFFYQIEAQYPITPAEVLRRVVDCNYGAMYWGHYCSDGELLHAFNEINRLLADYENIMLDGARVPLAEIAQISGLDAEETAVYRHNGQMLLLLLNQDAVPREITLKLKKPFGEIREFYSRRKFDAKDNTITIEITGGGVAAFILKAG